jgi:hypothetical protein
VIGQDWKVSSPFFLCGKLDLLADWRKIWKIWKIWQAPQQAENLD